MSTAATVAESGLSVTEEFVLRAELAPPVEVGTGPFGTRMYFQVTGGRVTGHRIHADVLPGGGDWALIGTDGMLRIDVRGQLRTDDGATIYTYYHGFLELNDAVTAALAGGSTEHGDHYFRTAPRFETGDERYAWLQRHIFVGKGRIVDGAVEYTVYRIG